MNLAIVRRWAYFSYDFIRSWIRSTTSVGQALRDLKKYQAMSPTDSRLITYRSEVLSKLLRHAEDSTEFYRSILSEQLVDFPVINKDSIRANPQAFRASVIPDSRTRTMKTSGSTGTPFAVQQDCSKVNRVLAEVIYFFREVGYDIGKELLNITPASHSYKRSRFSSLMTNQIRIGFLKSSGKEVEEVWSCIRSRRLTPLTILSLPNAYELLLDHTDQKDHAVNEVRVSGIVSSGSILDDRTRLRLQQRFQCPVVLRYSNQENGVLAQDTYEDNVFCLNQTNYLVEILSLDSDEPVSDGILGRVVITDFYNYAMPLIRYDTGDVAMMDTVYLEGLNRRVLRYLSGRRYDLIFDTENMPVVPNSLVNIVVDHLPQARQIQFIQKGMGRYALRINGAIEDNTRTEILDALREFLGENALIDVEFVSEIPTLSSGKRQTVVNESSLWEDPYQ